VITATETIQTALAAVVGDSAVSADPAACRAYSVDGIEPKLVVAPDSAEQVAEVLKCAAARGLGVIPVRNGTKLGIGNPPRRYDLALSLKSLNRVWHYEPADLTVTVEPGMKLGDFQHFLARDGLWLPLDPRGGARASIGGTLAANAAGPLSARYGAPRDMVLGMKIATADGKIIKAGGRVVKNVAGYDLGKLLIGSFGTLGVIVEASFKLYPRPEARATFVLSLESLEAARHLRRAIFGSPLDPLRIALLDRAAGQMVVGAGLEPAPANSAPFEFWLEAGGSERVLARYSRELEERAKEAGARMENREGAESAWDRIADFAWLVAESLPDSVILRASLPLDSSEEFLTRALIDAKVRASVSQPGTGVVSLVLPAEGTRDVAAASEVAKLRDLAEALAGALVVEHCRPELKPQLDAWGLPPQAGRPGSDFEMMRKMKATWDPNGILSPGRFVGGI